MLSSITVQSKNGYSEHRLMAMYFLLLVGDDELCLFYKLFTIYTHRRPNTTSIMAHLFHGVGYLFYDASHLFLYVANADKWTAKKRS